MEHQEQILRSVSQEAERVRSVYAQRKVPSGHVTLYRRCALHEREEALLRYFVKEGMASLSGLRILEIGCGTGALLRRLFDLGAEPPKCVGLDLRGDSLQTGRSLSPDKLNLIEGNAAQLPFADEEFDLVFQFTVFTSILDHELKQTIAQEMLRSLRRGGRLIWYDFVYSNPQNRNVRGIGKQEIRALLQGCKLRFQKVTLAPPIGRNAVRISPLLYHMLALVPILRTHYLCFAEKQ